MANLLLCASRAGLARTAVHDAVLDALRGAGHDVEETPRHDLGDLDAVLVLADGDMPPEAAAMLGLARGEGKAAFLVHGADVAPAVAALATRSTAVADAAAFPAAATALAALAIPLSGRVVRDQVPRLVREAGHDVRFREASAEERPQLLKRKVAAEARDLERAKLPDEKERVTDLLEALEALIRARGWDRDDLRLLKQAKLKRRGGFERCFVIDGTAPAAEVAAPAVPAPAAPEPVVEREPPAPEAPAPAYATAGGGDAETGEALLREV